MIESPFGVNLLPIEERGKRNVVLKIYKKKLFYLIFKLFISV